MLETLLVLIFCAGYLAIALEHPLNMNKGSVAILMGSLLWALLGLAAGDRQGVLESLAKHTGAIAGIIFFLAGAMTIVETIDLHGGFETVKRAIKTRKPLYFIWLISIATFFMSAVLDNLTTAIVMCSLVMKLLSDRKQQLFCAGLIIIAANSGGAWSPIGDVTTTMLWIGGQISASAIVFNIFIPSAVSLLAPLLLLSPWMLKMPPIEIHGAKEEAHGECALPAWERNTVLAAGVLLLLFVPAFKMITHLPPFMGMAFSLGVLWILAELLHKGKSAKAKASFSIVSALKRIDSPSAIFFLGILLAVSALEEAGLLHKLSELCDKSIGNTTAIAAIIGVLSAIIDNVPLVAGSMGMYSLEKFPTDHQFWNLIAYCAGTGGSMLVIGSAAGVAAMGIAKIEFFWYLKNVGPLALFGYLAGLGSFILFHM